MKFYNVEELCADKIAELVSYFPQAKDSHFSIAMFYRLFIPHLLLPQGIEKAFYLDSDIIVNLDISEFWEIELVDKPFGAVSRDSQIKDKATFDTSKVISLVRDGLVKPEDYFFSGGLLMNLKVLREKENIILDGIKFISEHSQSTYLDQDVLNYCFSTTYLKLPVNFNRVMSFERSEGKWVIEKKIYHYAANRITLGMDINDPYNRLWMDYFIKTPWVDDDAKVALSGGIPSRKNYSVSVVIPMYNAEKYIGETLESLLAQTFQDFEVIVVDDCSTDNSCAIVERYTEKFNGRLKLESTEKNSGGGGYVPRNIGVMLARGEYIQFLDADDMLLPTALEALYLGAVLYEAEVVYTSSYYRLSAPNDAYLYRDGTTKKISNVKTEFTVDDQNKNLSRLLFESGEGNFHNCWTKFVRREFLAKNRILFPYLPNAGDFIWVINVYCHLRRFLRISTPLYLYRRYNDNSILRTVRTPQEQCRYWFSGFVEFVKALNELKHENKILAANPLYCLEAFKKHFAWCLNRTEYARNEFDDANLFKVLYSEFAKNFSDSSALLLPFLFSFINSETKSNEYYSEIFKKFNRYFTAQIDMKFLSNAGDFQILSVSDNKANVLKPNWFQKDGIGYQIQSCKGSMEVVAKAGVDGKLSLSLRGLWVPNPGDNSKLIPYWIDYTKLIVNGKVIFDKLTPAWSCKSYRHALNVKADAEIKIQVEWLPHKGYVSAVAPPPEKVELPVADKFLPYLTGRTDIQLTPKTGTGDLQILSVSDNKANVRKANWLPKNKGSYFFIQSYVGKLKIVAKPNADGKVQLKLKGADVRTPEDKLNRIPYWIDYTKLAVNGNIILDKLTPVWHDKPYIYTFDVKADDEITIETEWLPHRSDVPEVAPLEKVELPVADKFLPYLTGRTDIQLTPKTGTGDLQILSVSDNKANVKKANWLPKNVVGYFIQSYKGSMKLVAKANTDGQVQLKLKGVDVRNSKDDSKRIPYWIDYTKLTINGKVIFDKATPTWHDKSYNYTLDVKAGEEITIETEWLPHRSES